MENNILTTYQFSSDYETLFNYILCKKTIIVEMSLLDKKVSDCRVSCLRPSFYDDQETMYCELEGTHWFLSSIKENKESFIEWCIDTKLRYVIPQERNELQEFYDELYEANINCENKLPYDVYKAVYDNILDCL